MNEELWREGKNPGLLLTSPGRKPSARKLRLFCCVCCRRAWPSPPNARQRHVLGVVERFADGLACAEGLRAEHAIVKRTWPNGRYYAKRAAWRLTHPDLAECLWAIAIPKQTDPNLTRFRARGRMKG